MEYKHLSLSQFVKPASWKGMNDMGKQQEAASTSTWDGSTVPQVTTSMPHVTMPLVTMPHMTISHEAVPILVPTPIKMVPQMSMEHPIMPVPQTPHVSRDRQFPIVGSLKGKPLHTSSANPPVFDCALTHLPCLWGPFALIKRILWKWNRFIL